MAKREFKGFMNLKYIKVKNVPVSEDKEFGELVQASVMRKIERKVACAILAQRLPITGLEIEFFRSILGFPQRKFAELFNLSQIAILKWERQKSKRLSLPNEIAFRVLMANHFKINIQIKALVNGPEKSPKQLLIDFEDSRELEEAA